MFSGEGRVTGWDNSGGNSKLTPTVPTSGYFGLGSTIDEVIAAQGTPTEINSLFNWYYFGSSRVVFSGEGRVTGWDNTGGNLKLR